jgi:putative ABC transport system permease protein
MRSWRTALRIARREARRARGRALLVVAMIAIPVAALAFAAVDYDTFDLSPAEQADRRMGSAQAAVSWPFDAAVRQQADTTELFAISILVPPPGTPAAEPTMDRMLALMPAGTRAVADQHGRLSMRTATGTGNIPARMLDYADPLAQGILRQVSGRAPATVDEVALTPAARQRLGAGVGDTVRLADGGRSFRVVGVVEEPNNLRATTIVLHPGALPAAQLSQSRDDLVWLVDTPGPVTWAAVKELNTHGLLAVSRHVLAHPPSQAERYDEEFGDGSDDQKTAVVLAGGLAMLEIVLLAGPAFAVGARRRQRDLALVAAAGGTPAHVRRIVLADGVVLGIVAAAAGVALGVVIAAAGRPLLEEYVEHKRSGALAFYPLALAVLAGLALVTGVLAALVPAWISSRQDVVTALSGRRGITRSRRRWIVVGAALGATGVAVATAGAFGSNATLIVAGLAIGELGLVLCTPALVGLVSRIGRWLPVAARIALRDASRNRTAAAPAVSAVMAAVVGSLAVAVIVVSNVQRDHDDYDAAGPLGTVVVQSNGGGGKGSAGETLSPQELATVRGTLPVSQVYQVSAAWCDEPCRITPKMPVARQCPYSSNVFDRDPTPAEQRAARRDSRCDGASDRYVYFGSFGFSEVMTFVVDPATIGAVFEVAQGDVEQAAAALRSGSVVVDDPRYVDNGRVTLTIRTGPRTDGAREVTVPAFAMPHRLRTPLALMTAQTATSLGLKASPLATLASTSRMPTVAEQDRLQAALGNGFYVYVERGPGSSNAGLLVLAVVAGVIALAAAAIATGLAAADGRADLTTLAAVGASPRLRRALSLSQSGVIAGLGSLIGAVAGVGASTAILAALNRANAGVWPAPTPYPIIVPWSNVAIAVLVVPAVAMLGAGLLTRSRLPIERRL